MQVFEIYPSKQGEGIWTGQSSMFVRFFGCHLRCQFCDTPYARSGDEGIELSLEEIIGRVLIFSIPHVVLTGGEPMLSPEIVRLTELLKEYDCQITIETSGTVFQPVICDLMSISPKLRNTVPHGGDLLTIQKHERNRSKTEIVQQLILWYNYQLKFVVDTKEDLHEVEEYLTRFTDIVPNRVLLMPQAVDVEKMHQKATWIEPFCRAKGYKYCPRMQLVWYGNKRRT
jgi:7-carboxy-7-deazaguanine synthase